VFQRPPPDHLPRHFVIVYRIQADHLGDLDHETKQVLDRMDAKSSGVTMSARLVSFDQKAERDHRPHTGAFIELWGRSRFLDALPGLVTSEVDYAATSLLEI
jgi:hypothetical protein